MTTKKIYSLCEAVADITFIAAKEKYETKDYDSFVFIAVSVARLQSEQRAKADDDWRVVRNFADRILGGRFRRDQVRIEKARHRYA